MPCLSLIVVAFLRSHEEEGGAVEKRRQSERREGGREGATDATWDVTCIHICAHFRGKRSFKSRGRRAAAAAAARKRQERAKRMKEDRHKAGAVTHSLTAHFAVPPALLEVVGAATLCCVC